MKYPKLEIITQYYEGFLESFVIDSSNVANRNWLRQVINTIVWEDTSDKVYQAIMKLEQV